MLRAYVNHRLNRNSSGGKPFRCLQILNVRLVGVLHPLRVTRPMVSNLKDQELVNGFDGRSIVGIYAYSPTLFSRHERVGDGPSFRLHYRDSRGNAVMDEDGHSKVVGAKHTCNVREVHANLSNRLTVTLVYGHDFYRSPSGNKRK